MKELIQLLMERIKVGIIANQQELNIKSSGASAQSLSAVSTETEGDLSGAKYFYQQIFGRRPGKRPPIENIFDWIERRGIKPRDEDTTLEQLAFLFARKIGREGTEIFKGVSPALAFNEIVDENVGKFQIELADFKAKQIADMIEIAIRRAFKQNTK